MLSRDELIDSFDIDTLPDWARSDEDVIRLAQINLGYRQDVIGAKKRRGWLVRKARLLRPTIERNQHGKTTKHQTHR